MTVERSFVVLSTFLSLGDWTAGRPIVSAVVYTDGECLCCPLRVVGASGYVAGGLLPSVDVPA